MFVLIYRIPNEIGFMVTFSILVCSNRATTYYMLNFILGCYPTKSEHNKNANSLVFYFWVAAAFQAFIQMYRLVFLCLKWLEFDNRTTHQTPHTLRLFARTRTIGMMHTILIAFRLTLPPMLVFSLLIFN